MSNEVNPENELTTSEEENESTQTEPTIEELIAERDKWKGHARDWENKAKSNKSAADKLKELEDANKTELEKAQARIAELEEVLTASEKKALRSNIIAEFGLDAEKASIFLTGQDEETLRSQAQALAELTKPSKTLRVDNSDIEGTPETNSKTAYAKSLLGL